jgi:hypothetical protein
MFHINGDKTMDTEYKLVDFTLCNVCINKEKTEKDEPCCECLKESARIHSHTPLKFKKEKK